MACDHAAAAPTLHARIVDPGIWFPEIAATQLELHAHHCTEAGLTKAVDYWAKAGQHAAMRSGREAETLLRKGLVLLGLPDTDQRQDRTRASNRIRPGAEVPLEISAPAVGGLRPCTSALPGDPETLVPLQWFITHAVLQWSPRHDIRQSADAGQRHCYIGCWVSWWP